LYNSGFYDISSRTGKETIDGFRDKKLTICSVTFKVRAKSLYGELFNNDKRDQTAERFIQKVKDKLVYVKYLQTLEDYQHFVEDQAKRTLVPYFDISYDTVVLAEAENNPRDIPPQLI
jgi:hypothetical protein